ncbi:MAG: T9SS type A sorting domain-containing protein, partial [Bacteroidota bacterium]
LTQRFHICIAFLSYFIFLSFPAAAQNPSVTFYGESTWDVATELDVEPDGSIMIAGEFGVDESQLSLMRLNPAGEIRYAICDTAQTVSVRGHCRMGNNNMIVVGRVSVGFPAQSDGFIAEFNPKGKILRYVRVGVDSAEDEFREVEPLANGGLALWGITRQNDVVYGDGWFVRLDADWNIVAESSYGALGWNYNSGFVQLPPTFALQPQFVGFTSTSDGEQGILTAAVTKFNWNGSVIWSKLIGTTEAEQVHAAALAHDGNILMLGSSTENGWPDLKFWLTKLDVNGNVLWSKEYDTQLSEEGRDLHVEPNGDIIITGDVWLGGLRSAAAIKVDSAGTLVWIRNYGTASGFEKGHATVADPLGSGYISLVESYGPFGYRDLMLFRSDAGGNTPCRSFNNVVTTAVSPTYAEGSVPVQTVNSQVNDLPYKIVKRPLRRLVLCENPTAKSALEQPAPEAAQASAFPNPFQDRLSIQADFANSGAAHIRIFDATGRIVLDQQAEVRDGHLDQQFDLAHLPAGQYHLVMTCGSERISRPLAKITH